MRKLSVESWSPALGAEVHDLDLGLELGGNEELAAATVESIYDALIDHQVLFFRNQPLTPELHVRLGQLLGDLAPSITATTHCPNTAMWQCSTGSRAIGLTPRSGTAT